MTRQQSAITWRATTVLSTALDEEEDPSPARAGSLADGTEEAASVPGDEPMSTMVARAPRARPVTTVMSLL
jgi:hypothetical protein